MKKKPLSIAVLGILTVLSGYAQDPNENFVRVEVPRIPLTDMARVRDAAEGEVLRSETLYDGLGRKVQTVQTGAAPDKKDLIKATGYDLAGRKVKQYLPYARESGDNDTLPEYRYDANGNMTEDANKGIVKIRYDRNNMPVEIDFENNRSIHYLYDANGTKLRKEVYGEGGHLERVTDYDGAFVYRDGRMDYLLTEEGRLVHTEDQGWQYEYFLKDHLGNTRVTFRIDTAGRAVAIQENHYYPFGLSIATLDHTSLPEEDDQENKYLYNGKELQDENGLA